MGIAERKNILAAVAIIRGISKRIATGAARDEDVEALNNVAITLETISRNV
ncbi:MAG: hypothetical protein QXM31_02755 [Candidatus Woesearchaeota archaeon]